MRTLLPLLMLLTLPATLDAQVRAAVASTSETDDCRVRMAGVARSGVGFVCDRGTASAILIVAHGGEADGSLTLIYDWAVRARDTGNNRTFFAVRHREPSPEAREVCEQFALPGPNARDPQPMQCRELESAFRR